MAFYSLLFQSGASFSSALSLCSVKHSPVLSAHLPCSPSLLPLLREVLSRASRIVADLSPLPANYSTMATLQVPRCPQYHKSKCYAHTKAHARTHTHRCRLMQNKIHLHTQFTCSTKSFNWGLSSILNGRDPSDPAITMEPRPPHHSTSVTKPSQPLPFSFFFLIFVYRRERRMKNCFNSPVCPVYTVPLGVSRAYIHL